MYKKILQRILPLTIAAFGTMGHAQNRSRRNSRRTSANRL